MRKDITREERTCDVCGKQEEHGSRSAFMSSGWTIAWLDYPADKEGGIDVCSDRCEQTATRVLLAAKEERERVASLAAEPKPAGIDP